MIFKFTENCFIMCLSFYSLMGSKEFIPTASSKLCTAYFSANSLFCEVEADVWALGLGVRVRRVGEPSPNTTPVPALKDFKAPGGANTVLLPSALNHTPMEYSKEAPWSGLVEMLF